MLVYLLKPQCLLVCQLKQRPFEQVHEQALLVLLEQRLLVYLLD